MLTRAPLRIRAQGGRAGAGAVRTSGAPYPHFGSGSSAIRIRVRMAFISPRWALSAVGAAAQGRMGRVWPVVRGT